MNILTMDAGGSSVKYALMNSNLEIIEKGKVKTILDNLDDYIELLGGIYDKYADQIEGVAFSMPGVIDPETGYFYSGGAYDEIVGRKNMKEILYKRIPTKISIGNDAKCAAYAEVGYGALKDVNDSIVIVLGTGIGGALIKDKKVINGKHFSAGEFSFISIDEHKYGIESAWARRGGSSGLADYVQKYLENEEPLTGEQIFKMANQGNEKVLAGIHDFAHVIAWQIFNLHIIFDPERIAIGGGISVQPILFEEIDKCLDKFVNSWNGMAVKPEIVPCKFNNDANLIGALYKFMVDYNYL